MNRVLYSNFIEEKLNSLATRIESRGKLNILDLHLHSENFYCYLLNEIYGWELINLNAFQQNVEGIDLIDHKNRFIVQVSSTCTKNKIETSLKKKICKDYSDYRFKFISISKDAENLRKKNFLNPYNISFDTTKDIIDKNSILNTIVNSTIDDLKGCYEFIKKELGESPNPLKLSSNLALVINFLSKESFGTIEMSQINSFEIDRKIDFNQLEEIRMIIDDYAIYHSLVDKIFNECDAQGINKSLTVLQSLKKIYLKFSMTINSPSELFKIIIKEVQERILKSTNFVQIPIEELEFCIDVLVVDAFIRCKIFKNPLNYSYVVT